MAETGLRPGRAVRRRLRRPGRLGTVPVAGRLDTHMPIRRGMTMATRQLRDTCAHLREKAADHRDQARRFRAKARQAHRRHDPMLALWYCGHATAHTCAARDCDDQRQDLRAEARCARILERAGLPATAEEK